MGKKTSKFYTKERDNYYQSLIERLDINRTYTDLSFDEFVKTYFQHHTQDEFGKQVPLAFFHKKVVKQILKRDQVEYAIILARNHAKTTVFSLFLPIYLMLKGETNFVLLISATKDLAVRQLINIQTELETNSLLINDFGSFTKNGNWSKGNFIVNRYDTAFYAVGKGQTTRGLKFGHYRPDLVILDDVDTDADVRNPNIVTKQTNWILQSVFPAMSIKKYRFLILGNKFAPNMVLTNIAEQVDGIQTLQLNAITSSGKVAWKERFKMKDLNNIKKKIGKIRFEREFLNNPIVEGSVFKSEWIEWFNLSNHKFDVILTYVDPSFKKTGDFKACITVGYADNKYYILELFEKKVNMDIVFNYLYDIQKKYGSEHVTYIESNFAQDLHKETYDKIAKKKKLNLPIVWDKSKKPNKEARIENMSIYFEQGLVFFNEKIKGTTHFKQFYLEYMTFPSAKNDDGIDGLEGAITNINKKMRQRNDVIVGYRESGAY